MANEEDAVPHPAQHTLQRYLAFMDDQLKRVADLINVAAKIAVDSQEVAQDILRSAVVLNHAYLEDLLRTVASALLPDAGEEALNDVPLSGLGNSSRPEKFSLGKLVRHKGKSVDEVIRLSVSEYLDRSTFNTVTDIKRLLKSLGIRLADDTDYFKELRAEMHLGDVYGTLEAMIKRRHQIVHKADRAGNPPTLQNIELAQVIRWLQLTNYLGVLISVSVTGKEYPPKPLRNSTKAHESSSATD